MIEFKHVNKKYPNGFEALKDIDLTIGQGEFVAIIGASADPSRIGGRPIATMLRAGFKGTIYPVNPNRAEIQGIKAYASVADLPETPDAAIIAVPGAQALAAIEALGQRGTSVAVIFSSGFAELGEEGAAAQAQLLAAARRHGRRSHRS